MFMHQVCRRTLDIRPDHWINDFLFEDVKLNQVVTDLTHVKYDQVKAKDSEKGRLLVGFSNGSTAYTAYTVTLKDIVRTTTN